MIFFFFEEKKKDKIILPTLFFVSDYFMFEHYKPVVYYSLFPSVERVHIHYFSECDDGVS